MMHQCIAAVNTCANNARMHTGYHLEHDPRKIILRLSAARGFKSARALALAAGLNQPTLSRYLADTTKDMEMQNFRNLANTLGVTVSQLLGESPILHDPRIDGVIRAMESMPEAGIDALYATAAALKAKLKADD
jgi:transcriptional regulator with XRE-family HTH domain